MTEDAKAQEAFIPPVRLGYDSQFTFDCHPGVSCFTQCCRGIDIVLTPYDIIQLKHRLELDSEQFLAIYTEPRLMEKTDLPVVYLRLLDDDRRSCPFVRDEGCLVYTDRPTACRYYPLGTASLMHKEGADDEGFFFFVHESHCKGFEEPREWTVAQWRQDQGVDVRDRINADWTDILVHKRSFPPSIKLTEKSKELFFMVCYNVDRFRRFVFESSFLDRYALDADTLTQIREDDVALLRFGLRWLKGTLFQVPESEKIAMKQGAGDHRPPAD
ncbi:MAG: YkgJ family cysteine cluster protein [Desulfobacterales bacterium]